MFDFVDLATPAEVAAAITGNTTSNFTRTLETDAGGPYMQVVTVNTGISSSYFISCNDSRIGSIIDGADGRFRLKLEAWKPSNSNLPSFIVDVTSPTNASYARLDLSTNFPEIEWRNTSGYQSEFDYAANWTTGVPWVVGGWNSFEIDNTGSYLKWSINGQLSPSSDGSLSRLNIQGANALRIWGFTFNGEARKIRNVMLTTA